MRFLIFCLLFCLGLITLNAQHLEGKWKGYFNPNNSPFGKIYSYEMEITQDAKNQLIVTSFSKLSNEFSAHAFGSGYFDKTTHLVHIEEKGFLDVSIQENFAPCLMNNYMSYKNLRGHEIIEGTYTSYNKKTGKDCGGGKLYLEKEIVIQSYLTLDKSTIQNKQKSSSTLKESSPTSKQTISNKETLKPIQNKLLIKTGKINKPTKAIPIINVPHNAKHVLTVQKTKSSPENLNNAIQNAQEKSVQDEPVMDESIIAEPEDIETEISIKKGNGFQMIPWVLVGRENKLAKKITTTSKQFSIDLYDNGTIDNDTIIVFDNKKLLVSKKRLSYKAIHLEFSLSDIINEHEIIIVAHNMGTVPPNTALLVLKDGNIRQELFITSTNKTNAKIIVSFTPPPKNE